MMKHLAGTAAAIALGLGLSLTGAAAAEKAAGTPAVPTAPAATAKTEGGYVMTRARGRVGGGYYRGGRRSSGGRIAGGIAAGIAGAIILNEIARPRSYGGPSYYYGGGGGLSCGQLEYRCDQGAEWACRRLDADPRC